VRGHGRHYPATPLENAAADPITRHCTVYGSAMEGVPLDADVRAAIARSALRTLPAPLITQLTAAAVRHRVAAGATVYREGDTVPHLQLVVSGLIRVYVSAPDGRTLTARYCRPGSLLGAATLFAADFAMPAGIQALVESDLLAMRPATVVRLADRDVLLARALLGETSERALAFTAEVAGTAFTSIRERVARHLLDLAAEHQRGPDLVARISQQELADAVGSVREVVVRVLRELRAEGIVDTTRREIVIHDPERLWNPGS
jgi:CRP/FNR family transcriptional regulator, cyclic AMP receptor protein